ncbi:hypothetical protein F5B20DRAFT_448324 [Whalleya microplaca]|nr:hypothetical protein F5B20DRAFT_448324 [Whalleya microplaca]
MAPQTSRTSAEPTLYEILALTPKHLEGVGGPAQQQKAVKQAYRRALLHHHPDKTHAHTQNNNNNNNNNKKNNNSKSSEEKASSPSSSSSTASPSTSTSTTSPSTTTARPPPKPQRPSHHYTIDQIQHAYAILSSPPQRAAYDRHLRTRHHPSSHHNPHDERFAAHAGVETLDLDDAGFDERTGVYFRACRCGNARGYAFTEDDLGAFEDEGVLMVECVDCSLWVRVLFAAAAAAADDDDDDEEQRQQGGVVGAGGVTVRGGGEAGVKGDGEKATVTARQQMSLNHDHEGGVAGAREAGGVKVNWSFNWGFSLSGSATAGSGR